MTTIVLCAGKPNPTNLPTGSTQSNAMLSVNGKPVIGWILEDLLEKGINEVTVVVLKQDKRLILFLQRAYMSRLKITLVVQSRPQTILHSTHYGLGSIAGDSEVAIVLGDTLIRDSFDGGTDFFYVGRVDDSVRWCVVEVDADGQLIRFHDKKTLPGREHMVVAGFYRFGNRKLLMTALEAALKNGEREMSALLMRYHQIRPVVMRSVCDWFDFGHLNNLIEARRRLLQPRHFNSLHIDPVKNVLTKVSEHNEKLMDELNWYLLLPDELKALTPRIFHHEAMDGKIKIIQEYYGYPTLAEHYVYADLTLETWTAILKHLLRIFDEFHTYTGPIDVADFEDMYVIKTWKRIDQLVDGDSQFSSLVHMPQINFNGQILQNIDQLRPKLNQRLAQLVATARSTIIHGDPCFANVLFDVHNQIVRFIDPRGSFGKKGIYGDPRYDLAKLRHSTSGHYEFIIADMFEVTEVKEGVYIGRTFTDPIHGKIADTLDQLLLDKGENVDDIRLIEGLLFVSMVPLHQDKPLRQKMMYLTGVKRLNEVLQ